jgi:prevent-host-death family protein
MKQVRIADLKARLSEYLRAVRRGETIAVLDRDTPVAQIVPIRGPSALRVRMPAPGASLLNRVRLPKPATELGTLDAIHLATALLWREMTSEDLTMATDDGALAMAAEAHGLPVVGAKRK